MAVGPVSGPNSVGPVFGEGGIPLPKLAMGNEVADRLVPGIAKALETVESEAPNTSYEQRRKHSQKLIELLMLLKGIVENKRARGESLEEEDGTDGAKDDKMKMKDDKGKKDASTVNPVPEAPPVPT